MNRVICLGLCAYSIVSCSKSDAPNWIAVETSASGAMYVDTSSIRRKGDLVSFWNKTLGASGDGSYTFSRNDVDCDTHVLSVLSMVKG